MYPLTGVTPRGESAAARAGSRPLPARRVGRCPRGEWYINRGAPGERRTGQLIPLTGCPPGDGQTGQLIPLTGSPPGDPSLTRNSINPNRRGGFCCAPSSLAPSPPLTLSSSSPLYLPQAKQSFLWHGKDHQIAGSTFAFMHADLRAGLPFGPVVLA